MRQDYCLFGLGAHFWYPSPFFARNASVSCKLQRSLTQQIFLECMWKNHVLRSAFLIVSLRLRHCSSSHQNQWSPLHVNFSTALLSGWSLIAHLSRTSRPPNNPFAQAQSCWEVERCRMLSATLAFSTKAKITKTHTLKDAVCLLQEFAAATLCM